MFVEFDPALRREGWPLSAQPGLNVLPSWAGCSIAQHVGVKSQRAITANT